MKTSKFFLSTMLIVVLSVLCTSVYAQSEKACSITLSPSQNGEPSEVVSMICFDSPHELFSYTLGDLITLPKDASPDEIRQAYQQYNDMVIAEAANQNSGDSMLLSQIVLGIDWTLPGYWGTPVEYKSIDASSGCRHGYQYLIPNVTASLVSSAYGVDCDHFPHWNQTNYTGVNIDCANHPACQTLPLAINNNVHSLKLYN